MVEQPFRFGDGRDGFPVHEQTLVFAVRSGAPHHVEDVHAAGTQTRGNQGADRDTSGEDDGEEDDEHHGRQGGLRAASYSRRMRRMMIRMMTRSPPPMYISGTSF